MDKTNDDGDKVLDVSFKAPTLPSPVSQKDAPKIEVDVRSEGTRVVDASFSYASPSWACKPLASELVSRLEVIKNGVVIENIPLVDLAGNGTYLSIGRFKPCHIQLEHPTVSRHHCVLQYGQFMSQDAKWFLYDLGSTHGTKLNKRQLKKHSYAELKPGYVFQIADSSRIFSFCGDVDEAKLEEEEDAAREARRPMRGPQLDPESGQSLEDDESSANEESVQNVDDESSAYYEKDPVGWLQRYFEREGLTLRFQYTKAETTSEGLDGMKPKRRKGVGSESDWICSIDLPDDSSANSAVTLIKASAFTRKLAQHHCALLACERLEASGLLRTYSMWNKRKSYADNDYYDSDEDTYFDRTGQIEEQREKRMRREEALLHGGTKAQNYEELSAKLADAENRLNIVRSELSRLMGKNVYTDSEGNAASSTNLSLRIALSQMRSKEKKFVAEVDELKKLVELCRPREWGQFLPAKPSKPPQPAETTNETSHQAAEERGVEGSKVAALEELEEQSAEEPTTSEDPKVRQEAADTTCMERQVAPERGKTSNSSLRPTADFLIPKYGILTKEEARIKHPMKVKRKFVQQDEDELKDDYSDIPVDSREDYSTWLPPSEQTGDGKTKLNEKFQGRY